MVKMATFMVCVFYHNFFKRREKRSFIRAHGLLRSHLAVQKPGLREARKAVWTRGCSVVKAGAAGPQPGLCPSAPLEQAGDRVSPLPSGTRGPESVGVAEVTRAWVSSLLNR